MSTLRASPFILPIFADIKAKIRAHNSNGWSDFSDPSTVFVTVKTEP